MLDPLRLGFAASAPIAFQSDTIMDVAVASPAGYAAALTVVMGLSAALYGPARWARGRAASTFYGARKNAGRARRRGDRAYATVAPRAQALAAFDAPRCYVVRRVDYLQYRDERLHYFIRFARRPRGRRSDPVSTTRPASLLSIDPRRGRGVAATRLL